MAITWGNIKLQTLQKMFATNNGSLTIPNDNSTREYISAMPGAANEALQMLATAGKFIKKSIDIAHIPLRNLISNGDKIKDTEGGEIAYEGEGARSFYYELMGKGTLTITIGENSVSEDFNTKEVGNGYVPFKKILNNPDKLKVYVSFASEYPMSLKNVALYGATFETEEEIPPYSEYVRYHLPSMVDDFYKIDEEHVIYEGDCPKYEATSGYFQEGYRVLLLPRTLKGNYKVYYNAYPKQITNETPDDEVLVLDPEVAALLPLYMASQLYKDDDSGIATVYRNEFEVAFERLSDSVPAPSSERFTSESGWI